MPFDHKRMKELRRRKKVSMAAMARGLGIPYQSIQEYERGDVEPKAHRLEQIADMLETTTEYLLGRTSYPNQLTEAHYRLIDAYVRGGIDAALEQARLEVAESDFAKRLIPGRQPRTKR